MDRVFLLKGLLKCGDCGSFMSPHYTQKRRKDRSINRISYYRCTKTMHFGNSVCGIKHMNADHVEGMVVQNLHELSQNESYLNMSVEELNRDLKHRIEPLESEAVNLKKRIDEIDAEMQRYVRALGQGQISLDLLEKEIGRSKRDRQTLQVRYDDLTRQMNEEVVRDYDAELVRRNLRDFQTAFGSLTPRERAEALQCVLKDVTVYPDKLVLNIFELPEFAPGSTNHTTGLPR